VKKGILLFFILCLLLTHVFGSTEKQNNQDTSLDLQDVNLSDALYTLAKMIHLNLIVSSSINDKITLHLNHISLEKTFNLLLLSHNLLKIPMGNTWFIVPKQDWLLHQQDQAKLQETMDATAPLTSRIWQVRYAKADDIAHLLENGSNTLLSKRGHVRVDTRTNMLYLQDTPDRLGQIQRLVARIDIPIKQILIEAHLASIDSDYEQNLGINFAVQNASTTQVATLPTFAKTHYSLLVAKLADGSLLDMQLTALENQGHGELISSPRLFTSNQQTATIESGEEIPYQEESLSGGTAVAFKKAVLGLKVTPQILPGNKVLLQLQVNQDRPSKLMVQGVPAINTRQMSTNVLLQNGQTVVLGGIYESNNEHAKQMIPFLGRIPILGWLFQQNDVSQNKRELLIFVTPRIIPS
jgi:type IV pilus assembly protein PilQ